LEVDVKGRKETTSDEIKRIEEIQAEFKKLYVKTNDQLDRVGQYLHELLTSDEFEQLTKKLKAIGVSVEQLKNLGDKLEVKIQKKREEQELFDEEILALRMINRDLTRRNMIEKIQGIQDYQKSKNEIQKFIFESMVNGTNEELLKNDKVHAFMKQKHEHMFDLSGNCKSNPSWFSKRNKKQSKKKQIASKVHSLTRKNTKSATKYVEGIIDSILNV
jgi:hypothetical protein